MNQNNEVWVKRVKIKHSFLAACAGFLAATTQAATIDLGNVSMNGFASIVAVEGTNERVYSDRSFDKTEFAGESRAGLQMNVEVNEQTHFVTQFLSRGITAWKTEMEWAFIKYEYADGLQFRAGRMRLPVFMMSEYLDVGYAYPWTRPPSEIYDFVQVSSMDGVDLNYQGETGLFDYNVQLYYGGTRIKAENARTLVSPAVSDTEATNLSGINLTFSRGNLSVRLAYSQMFLHQDGASFIQYPLNAALAGVIADTLAPNMSGYTQPPATTEDYINNQSIENDIFYTYYNKYNESFPVDVSFDTWIYFRDAGFQYDDGRFLVMGERVSSKAPGWFPDVEAGYLTAGVRFGKWGAFVTHSRKRTADQHSRSNLNVFGLSGKEGWTASDLGMQPVVFDAILSATTQGVMSAFNSKERTNMVTLKYDLNANADIKLEASRVYGFEGTNGLFDIDPINPLQPMTGRETIVRLAFDVAF